MRAAGNVCESVQLGELCELARCELRAIITAHDLGNPMTTEDGFQHCNDTCRGSGNELDYLWKSGEIIDH